VVDQVRGEGSGGSIGGPEMQTLSLTSPQYCHADYQIKWALRRSDEVSVNSVAITEAWV
jgi:hypothetical protein